MNQTKIEWTDASWSPVTGCSPVSSGCKNCYARRFAYRLRGRFGYPEDNPFQVTLHPDRLNEPLHWKMPRKVFICSMGDLFHEDVKLEWLREIFEVIHKAKQHTFLILTKRIKRMAEFFGTRLPEWGENIWLGVSCENQKTANERIPILLDIPAEMHFVSLEPLLENVDLTKTGTDSGQYLNALTGNIYDESEYLIDYKEDDKIDWIIVGGESGLKARPMHPHWVKSIRDQCINFDIPFFFKQWGEWCLKSKTSQKAKKFGVLDVDGTFYENHTGWNGRDIDPDTNEAYLINVGKKHTGHELDGKIWNEFPETIK